MRFKVTKIKKCREKAKFSPSRSTEVSVKAIGTVHSKHKKAKGISFP